MPSLDERLTRLEDRLDAIHELLTKLVEGQVHASGEQTDNGAAIDGEPTVEINAAELNELMSRIQRERDPLDIQYDIVLAWGKNPRKEKLSEFNLAGRNLRNVDLKGAVLNNSNFSKADLTGGKLIRTDLSDADLSRAQLGRVDFSKANMERADLTFAHIAYAKLEGANLRYASLTRANLSGANISKVDFSGAQINRADMTRANLQDALVTYRQLATVGALDSAIMPDGRIFDGDYEPYKR